MNMKKIHKENNTWKIDTSPVKKLIKYRYIFLAGMILAFVFYSLFITQQLTNTYDGLWLGSLLSAGEWEISLGRWMLIYLDRLHLGMQTEPIATCAVLAFILAGSILIVDMFRLRGTLSWLVPASVMTSTIVTCIASYRYTSISYALCMFLSVAAVWFLMAKTLGHIRYILSTASLVCALGIYQADISITAVLMIFAFIMMLLEKRDPKEIWRFVIEAVIVIVVGCIVYRIIAVLHMQLLDIAAADYMGADDLSVMSMIISLPKTIIKCYQHFYRFFLTDGFFWFNVFQRFWPFKYIFAGFMLLIVIMRLFRLAKDRRFISLGLVIAALAVLPIACDLSLIFAPETTNYMLQQTFGVFMVFPCVLCLLNDRGGEPEKAAASLSDGGAAAGGKKRNFAKGIFVFLAVFFIHGNALQCNRDIMAMYEGRNATRAMMERMVDELMRKGLLSRDRQYAIMGSPADNKTLFVTTDLFDRVNAYARYGKFWNEANAMNMSYKGLTRDISVNMPIVDNDTWNALHGLDEVKSMQAFPAEGSIKEVNGVIVIKLAYD